MLHTYLHTYLYLPDLPVCQPITLSTCLPTCCPIYLSTNLLPYLPVYQPISLSTCLFDHHCCLLIVHLRALQNIMHSWTHGGDPVDLLLINQHVEKFKVVDSAVQFPSIGPSIHPSSIYPSTYPSTPPSTRSLNLLFIHPCIELGIHPSIHLSPYSSINFCLFVYSVLV